MTTATPSTVLYVDDEAMALKYFERLIGPHYTVLTAISVEAGIEVLKAHGPSIMVLISDQRMPGANGNELLRYARHHFPHIVRLLTTAYSELGEAIVAINSGEIYRYITKPWDAQTLTNEVRLAVEVSELRGERDELARAKINVQQAQLMANRVNNLALTLGLEASPSAALQQYTEIVKQLGGAQLAINWRSLHYSDWMQNEVIRHRAMGQHIEAWQAKWKSPSVADLMTALGTDAFSAERKDATFKGLLADNSKSPSPEDCAWLAWLLALHRAGQHDVSVAELADGSVSVTLSPAAPTTSAGLPPDWLASAMEDLEMNV